MFSILFWAIIASIGFSLIIISLFIQKYIIRFYPLMHRKAFEHSNDGIIMLDVNYNILAYNNSASSILINLDKSAIGRNAKEIFVYYENIINSVLENKETTLEIGYKDLLMYYSVISSIIYDKFDNINGYMITLRDMTKYYEAMSKLNSIASYDELTSVHTRRCFLESSFEKIANARKNKHAISFIILDLDFFKEINDKFGHQAGDYTLKIIADLCKKSVRSSDVIGRFGGEEFVILLPDTSPEEANTIANRICKDIEEYEIYFEDNLIKTTASFGITGILSVKNENLETLFKHADKALYQAKAAGRNCTKVLPI